MIKKETLENQKDFAISVGKTLFRSGEKKEVKVCDEEKELKKMVNNSMTRKQKNDSVEKGYLKEVAVEEKSISELKEVADEVAKDVEVTKVEEVTPVVEAAKVEEVTPVVEAAKVEATKVEKRKRVVKND